MYEFRAGEPRIEIGLKADRSFPLWSYGSYVARVDSYYRKLSIVDRICQLKIRGIDDSDLVIAMASVQLFPEAEIEYADFQRFVNLTSKSEDPREFWHEIEIRERPAVFYKDGPRYIPILSLREGTLDLNNAVIKSPGEFSISGFASFLISLFFSGREDQRRQELHQIAVSEGMMRQLREMADLAIKLEDPRLPPGVRRYALEVFKQVVERHRRDLLRLGIRIVAIDLYA